MEPVLGICANIFLVCLKLNWKMVYLLEALGIMFIFKGNGLGYLSSNPGWGCLHFT